MNFKYYKFLFDVIYSLFSLAILVPFFLLIAIGIKIDSNGAIIFKQDRIGFNGKIFQMYKFRTMCICAEKYGVFEKKNDPRVTKIGKILRRTSIDELPQLFNIIKGDMAIIGPRPVLIYHPWRYCNYSNEQKKRFQVKPGITGLAQINGRKELSWKKRIKYDIEYVEKFSFNLDLLIFIKTIYKVIKMQDNLNVDNTVKNKSILKNES